MIRPGSQGPGFVHVANNTLTRRRTEAPCAIKQKAGGLATRRLFVPDFCRLRLDQRPPRGRPLRTAARFRLALPSTGQLFRLRRDRSLDELEADLVLAVSACLVLDQHDADMAAALQVTEQHLVRQRLLD